MEQIDIQCPECGSLGVTSELDGDWLDCECWECGESWSKYTRAASIDLTKR